MKDFKFWTDAPAGQIEQAPKGVSFTVTPIGDTKALGKWRIDQDAAARARYAEQQAKFFAARERAITAWMEFNAKLKEASASEKVEYSYRETRKNYLNYVDKHVYGKQNQVICTKCSSIAIINQALGKDFYYCRECKDEVNQ